MLGWKGCFGGRLVGLAVGAKGVAVVGKRECCRPSSDTSLCNHSSSTCSPGFGSVPPKPPAIGDHMPASQTKINEIIAPCRPPLPPCRGFDIDSWRAHINELTWPEVARQLAITAGLGRRRPRPRKEEKPKMGQEG